MRSVSIAGAYALSSGASSALYSGADSAAAQTIPIRTDVVNGKLSHIWEECVGSDRAVVGLRQQWLSDLEVVRSSTGMKSVRFHGLFNDEMGVWPSGAKQPNFLYVDMVFDAMMDRGLKPLVELSFMPGALASGTRTLLWYRGNTTPPKDPSQWGELVGQLAKHLVDRYGEQEVVNWNFEVWNEPNIMFWAGTKADYFELYRQSVNAIKKVDKRLRVGGPSTARVEWVKDLLDFCATERLPIDFASTHVYPDDPQAKLFGEGVHYPLEEVIPKALAQVQQQIKESKFPDLPLYITEWSSQNPAFIAHTIKSTIGLADMMSFWTFDNVYEELGVPKTFVNTGFGLLGMRGVTRPSFHAFALLHRLGDVQLDAGDGPILATRRPDGSLAILVWYLIPQPPGQRSATGDPLLQTAPQYDQKGEALNLTLALYGAHLGKRARITRVDSSNGNFRHAYEDIGCPSYPTREQIAELKRRCQLRAPESASLDKQNRITLSVPPNGIALVELG